MWNRCGIFIIVSLGMSLGNSLFADERGPFQATGFKVGEVTKDSAIVWTRLTRRAERNGSDGPMVRVEYEGGLPVQRRHRRVKALHFPDGATVSALKEAAPGVDGETRVLWQPRSAGGTKDWQSTDWRPVDPLADFTRQFQLTGLLPGTAYLLRVEARGVDGAPGATLDGAFRTAPAPTDPAAIRFTVATCFGNDDQDCPEGFKIYESMRRLDPDFFVHAGDIIYYDELAKTADLARYHWQRMYGQLSNVLFHRNVASYFVKDDHDTWCNDCWPTMRTPSMHDFTFRQGQAIFREQVPMGETTYRVARWGRDLQIWFVEGRDFRSPNDMPDGPDKTIWGEDQKAWLKETVAESNASFRVLVSPTPIVGPDRAQKADNHANAGFRHEGDEIRQFLASQKNMIVVCGDRHWQYASRDPDTGLREYCCGAASDPHAGGWKQEDYRPDMHRFLRVKGGFLSVWIGRERGEATMTVQLHDVDGNVMFEDRPFGEPQE